MTLVEFIPIVIYVKYFILLYFIITFLEPEMHNLYSANFCLGIVLDHAES